mmetsp:Transcript_28227/g.25026  ORF Transcript_28227/g.25026 Transcript_28227/m.25026 type:complete len:95 (+) Transcript_28227:71-355(+)|eukprot:CAMPEP_0114576656 /NCGR_PEP_ID=MMETSP0125-20121206/1391_1 /TAXON_ID=485358 ORGANISM="Aristerostoma sp., Strain ATCC 50986" /NCGR_SAMPLE_ID=MMETSP0125 /ASSEMBLY_ACC=CAM_ASM_000245 /LENGTH=94 /DNA_ID=CAMNT_0001765335 /DNA_START=67 /DNA_END=351 /DNA_ORIENTATION=+
MGKIKAILNDPDELKRITELAFNQVDTDKSGSIDMQELAALMNKVADQCNIPKPSESDVKEAWNAMDTNKDGKISVEEFGVLVKEILSALAASE